MLGQEEDVGSEASTFHCCQTMQSYRTSYTFVRRCLCFLPYIPLPYGFILARQIHSIAAAWLDAARPVQYRCYNNGTGNATTDCLLPYS